MDKEYMDSIKSSNQKEKKLDPDTFEKISRINAVKSSLLTPYTAFMRCVFKDDKTVGFVNLKVDLSGLIILFSDNFDESIQLINAIKDIIIQQEKSFIKEEKKK